ncbi:MAG: ABC transporter permease [Melioribacteraceae bacterium]|nr:ABC transporter permease [Melioribacteraceae bacterium]
MNNIINLLKKDFIRFIKDKTAVLLTFAVPAVLIVIFGNIFGGSGNSRGKLPVIFVNESNYSIAAKVEEKLDSSGSLRLVREYWDDGRDTVLAYDTETAKRHIKEGKISTALVIPSDFMSDTSTSIKVQIYYDPKNEIESSIIQGSLQQVIMGSIPELFPQIMNNQINDQIGIEKNKEFQNELADIISETFKVEKDLILNQSDSVSVFNFGSSGENNFINDLIKIENIQLVGQEVKNPGVTRIVGGWAMMFLLFSLTGAATSLFEEKQEGSLKRLLCMPVKRSEIIWSKYIFSIFVGMLQLSVLFLFAWVLFDVDIFSNFLNLMIVILVSAAAAVSFAMIITATTSSLQQANGIATLIIMVMSAIGGSWFPVSFLPDWMQVISKFTLTYWSIEAFLQVLWRDGDIASIALHLGILTTIAVVVNYYAILLFKKGKIF